MGDTKSFGKIGARTLIFYLATTALAITIALGVGNLIDPGIGLDITSINTSETAVAEATSVADVVSNFFSQFNDLMMEMTTAVMTLAPIGVFCLIAKTFSGIGFSAFIPLAKYMISVMLALIIHCFVVYLLLLKGFTGLSPITFLKKFAPVMSFAFSTATSNATIPLGATINMDGTAIMQGVAVVFAAQAFNIPLSPMDYLTVILTATLASVGTAGVPSVGLITLSMVFTSVGLPVEAIGLIMGIDRILDMSRTAVNITGDAVCTTIIAHQNGLLDREKYDSQELAQEAYRIHG